MKKSLQTPADGECRPAGPGVRVAPRSKLSREWALAVVQLLEREPAVVRIVVAQVRGSAPREPGAFMLVGRGGVEGTIGGGRLEWESIAAARELLDDKSNTARLNTVVLGADLGQCCGGVVAVWLERFTREDVGFLRLAREAGARGHTVLSSTVKGALVERRLVRAPGSGGDAIASDVARGGDATGCGQTDLSRGGDAAGCGQTDLSRGGDAAGCGQTDLSRGGDAAGCGQTGLSRGGDAAGCGQTDLSRGGDAAGCGQTGLYLGDDLVAAQAGVLLRKARGNASPFVARDLAGGVRFLERLDDELPAVWLYGAGHVGQALARILAELPLRLTWIDSRADLFPTLEPDGVRIRCDADSLASVSDAPADAYFLVMTHSHPLDFALCQAILARNDFAWLGLIGSESKAARFRSRLRREGLHPEAIARLVCPIGVAGIESKWPAAIAVGVAAQVMQRISAAAQDHGGIGHAGAVTDCDGESCATCGTAAIASPEASGSDVPVVSPS